MSAWCACCRNQAPDGHAHIKDKGRDIRRLLARKPADWTYQQSLSPAAFTPTLAPDPTPPTSPTPSEASPLDHYLNFTGRFEITCNAFIDLNTASTLSYIIEKNTRKKSVPQKKLRNTRRQARAANENLSSPEAHISVHTHRLMQQLSLSA